MPTVEEAILKNLETFVAFVRSRVGDHHLAEDVVQDSLIKALAADKKPSGDEATVAWFYRILRRSIIDLYRRQGARTRALEKFEQDLPDSPDPAAEKTICQCLRRILPNVPTQYRTLIERIDLDGQSIESVAETESVTKNNLTVRLHRARKSLRDALIQNCQACGVHGCIDCSCEEES